MATDFEEFRERMFKALAEVAKKRDEVLGFDVIDEPDMARYVMFYGNRVCMVRPEQWRLALEQGEERKNAFVTGQIRKLRGKTLLNPYGNVNIFRVDHVQDFVHRALLEVLSALPDKGAAIKLGAQEVVDSLANGEPLSKGTTLRQLNNVIIEAVKSALKRKETKKSV